VVRLPSEEFAWQPKRRFISTDTVKEIDLFFQFAKRGDRSLIPML
jgi:hypothetical protein